MDAEVLRRRLAAFLPRSLWPLIGSATSSERMEGCVLFADLAGFTRLTESLAKIGKEGAEELTRILNDFFAAMIRVVHSEGGDVLRFGGDAMTLLFPEGMENGLRAAVLMQREAARYQAISTRGGTFELGMKIGISAGSVLLGLVGDPEVGQDYFAAGGALDSAAEAEHHATRGQIAVSLEGLERLKNGTQGLEILGDGFGLIANPLARVKEPTRKPGTQAISEPPRESSLEAFLPPFITQKAGDDEGLWVAEHRRTTVLFLSFSGLDYDGDPDAHSKVDEAFRRIAGTVRRFGGVVNKVDMGDKGSKVIALFGAPFALEHQEEAACRAAMMILADSTLRALLSEVRIGITVAPLFAAYVGSDERREFTVMGDGINMSARLMANAHAWRVICSREVMEQSFHALAFRELDPIFVKGKREKVAIFRPEGEREAESDERAGFVGRRELLNTLLPRLVGPSAAVLLAMAGEPGVGKSALLHRLGLGMDEAGIRHATVPLSAHGVHSYMVAWRSVLFGALGVSRGAPAQIREAALRSAMAGEDSSYLPLFNPLLGVNLAETEASEALSAKDRKDVLFAMLTRLFLGQAGDGPYGIFLDHLEYADPASLEFLQVLVAEAGQRPLKLLVAYRSRASEVLAGSLDAFETIDLGPLSQDETKEFLIQAASMAPPTETFLGFIHKKTGGNPKFLRQFLSVMEKEGLASIGPSGLLEVDEDRLATASFPDTLEGLLLSRVDALLEEERAFLKAAAVLGASFSLNLLQTLLKENQGAMLRMIRSLEEKGIIRMDTWGARPYATFTDSLLRDALYESLNFSTKRAFHGRVAELLENQGGREPRLWPALAHHFEAAGRCI